MVDMLVMWNDEIGLLTMRKARYILVTTSRSNPEKQVNCA
jgi:hypothetical protein